MRFSARLLLLSGLLSACLIGTPAASAAPVRECGQIPSSAAYNITSRVVSCLEARRVVRSWSQNSARPLIRGLRCRYRNTGYESGDIRCSGSRGRVVHWQTGV